MRDEEFFMAIAYLSSERSKDPKTQVGACIVNEENKIVGIGFNGMPNNCSDEIFSWKKKKTSPDDHKGLYVCHAELNAILNKTVADLKGCTIYVTHEPCSNCAALIIESGIKHVRYLNQWGNSNAPKKMIQKAGITHEPTKTSIIMTPEIQPSPDNDSLETGANIRRTDYLSWSEYFMAIASLSAQNSDKEVGACIINTDKRIVGIGYGETTGSNNVAYDCHAIVKAIFSKYLADIRGATLFTTEYPCTDCTKMIIQSGIKSVVYLKTSDNQAAKSMLTSANVVCTPFNKVPRVFDIAV